MGQDEGGVENVKMDSRLKSIESRIDHFLPEVENVIAQRVYQAARDKLSNTVKYFSVFVAILAGVLGYQSYKQIIDIGGTKVAELIAESVIPELQKDVETQIDNRLEELMVNAQVKANAKMDQKIAEVSVVYQEKLQSLIDSSENIHDSEVPLPRSLDGYALYGEGREGDDGKWIWVNRNFRLIEGHIVNDFPDKGMLAVADTAVLVRDQAPSVRYEIREQKTRVPFMKGLKMYYKEKVISKLKIPVLDESSSKQLGSIKAETQVEIKSVQKVLGKFVWVEISPKIVAGISNL